jgi:hypothetical protein
VKSIANSNTTSYSGRVAGRVYVIVNYFQAAPKVPGKTGGIREAPQFLFGGSTEIAPLCEVAPITKPPVSGLMSTPGPKLSRRSSLGATFFISNVLPVVSGLLWCCVARACVPVQRDCQRHMAAAVEA